MELDGWCHGRPPGGLLQAHDEQTRDMSHAPVTPGTLLNTIFGSHTSCFSNWKGKVVDGWMGSSKLENMWAFQRRD